MTVLFQDRKARMTSQVSHDEPPALCALCRRVRANARDLQSPHPQAMVPQASHISAKAPHDR